MIGMYEPRRRERPLTSLIFSPLAWLKLQFFCHAGRTEIAGFGITAKDDLLYVEDFLTVRQRTSPVTVAMDDTAVADFSDRCVDAGLSPQRYLRVWCHTHPGSSPEPSGVDEATFERVFGFCDWAVMFIVSRTGKTFARLSFHAGPGGAMQLPVSVDWSAWPSTVKNASGPMAILSAAWQAEYAANIHPIPEFFPASPVVSGPTAKTLEPAADVWTDLDQQIWEEFEHHERAYCDDLRP